MVVPEIVRLAGRQHGLFTRAQARATGYSAYQIRQRIAAGEWVVVLGTVLAAAALPVPAGLLDRAAALAVPDGVLAGPSAARLHGMPVPDQASMLVVPPWAHPRIAGVTVRYEALPRGDLVRVDGVPVTNRPRTAFDCARLLGFEDALASLEWALQRRWITVEQYLHRVQCAVGRRGAPQLVRLARLVGSGAQSAAERRALLLLRRAGISGWQANAPIRDLAGTVMAVGDLVFERRRLVVEIDGMAYHVTPEAFQRDRERQNALVAMGWTVLRFTWADVERRPDQFVATVADLLAGRAR